MDKKRKLRAFAKHSLNRSIGPSWKKEKIESFGR